MYNGKKKSSEYDTLGIICVALISELKKQILIVQSEKYEVKDKLSSCMEDLMLKPKLE